MPSTCSYGALAVWPGQGDAELVDAVLAEIQLVHRDGEREVLADARGELGELRGVLAADLRRSSARLKPVRFAASSMAARPSRVGPDPQAHVGVGDRCLPLLVTVPETVSGVPLPGALGVSESTADVHDRRPVAWRPARRSGGVGRGAEARPARRPGEQCAVRRSHRRAGEGVVPWKSAASATRSPVPRRRQCVESLSNVRPRMVTMRAGAKCCGVLHKIVDTGCPYAGRPETMDAPGRRGPRTLFCCAERQRRQPQCPESGAAPRGQ